MHPVAPPIEAKEGITFDDKGVLCMTVVDPVTRKLLIPLNHVYPTRAQQRTTIPSLCQLFLNGRCRQGAQCHQVHASPDMVTVLRSQVETLPRCCALHGDRDYVGVMDDQSWVSRVVVHVADAAYEGGYIPLSRFSYTIPVSKMLNRLPLSAIRAACYHKQLQQEGRPHDVASLRVVLEAGDIPLCRLHVLERCRYAEECSFLHICKEVAQWDQNLTLGRRPRSRLQDKQSVSPPMCTGPFCVQPPPMPIPMEVHSPVSSSCAQIGSPSISSFGASRGIPAGDASIATLPAPVTYCGLQVSPAPCPRVSVKQPPPAFVHSHQSSDVHLRQASSTFFPSDNLSLDIDPSSSGDCLVDQGCRKTPNIVVVTSSVEGGRERWRYDPYESRSCLVSN
uniref:C3H1-type domain-containing protein n=1 Tax=Trypanosoma congolense (strain IL3000) TaxID=1068625 RepID=G0UPS7_TRYCI|nr:conserved hypothetical protein [Trypanosoma congolense IL3000]